MNLNRADMADLLYFCAIALHHSFSKAAVELGVSASTLSHALKGFEARLGNRTTKSVTLTAAGESLAQAVSEPDDLHQHRCVSNRLGNNRIYKWEFERGEEQLTIKVPPLLTVDQAETGVVAILQGFGLMFPEPLIAQHVREGRLRLVLSDWASWGPGFYIYYSSRHQLPTGLRLLISLVRELKPLGL